MRESVYSSPMLEAEQHTFGSASPCSWRSAMVSDSRPIGLSRVSSFSFRGRGFRRNEYPGVPDFEGALAQAFACLLDV